MLAALLLCLLPRTLWAQQLCRGANLGLLFADEDLPPETLVWIGLADEPGLQYALNAPLDVLPPEYLEVVLRRWGTTAGPPLDFVRFVDKGERVLVMKPRVPLEAGARYDVVIRRRLATHEVLIGWVTPDAKGVIHWPEGHLNTRAWRLIVPSYRSSTVYALIRSDDLFLRSLGTQAIEYEATLGTLRIKARRQPPPAWRAGDPLRGELVPRSRSLDRPTWNAILLSHDVVDPPQPRAVLALLAEEGQGGARPAPFRWNQVVGVQVTATYHEAIVQSLARRLWGKGAAALVSSNPQNRLVLGGTDCGPERPLIDTDQDVHKGRFRYHLAWVDVTGEASETRRVDLRTVRWGGERPSSARRVNPAGRSQCPSAYLPRGLPRFEPRSFDELRLFLARYRWTPDSSGDCEP